MKNWTDKDEREWRSAREIFRKGVEAEIKKNPRKRRRLAKSLKATRKRAK